MSLFSVLGAALGVVPGGPVGLVAASMALNVLGKAIPDDKTGALGLVRKAAKVGGLYISNRIESGVDVNDVVKGKATPDLLHEARADSTKQIVGNIAEQVLPGLIASALKKINPVTGKPRAQG